MVQEYSLPPATPNEVENPIINSPFVEPQLHWHIERGQLPAKIEGRRAASYYYRVPDSAARGRKNNQQLSLEGDISVGEREDLPIVNWLRQAVKRWRTGELTNNPYDGVSRVTKELLALWQADSTRRKQRLFYAQLEAAETIIFLMEANPIYHKGMHLVPVDHPGDSAREAGFKALGLPQIEWVV